MRPAALTAIGGLLLAVAVAAALVDVRPAAAAPGLTVDPAQGLEDGDEVRVAWTGFVPSSVVYVTQCRVPVRTIADCSNTMAETGFSDAAGAGSFDYAVWAGQFQEIAGGELRPGPLCGSADPCAVTVTDDLEELGTWAAVPIGFARDTFVAPVDDEDDPEGDIDADDLAPSGAGSPPAPTGGDPPSAAGSPTPSPSAAPSPSLPAPDPSAPPAGDGSAPATPDPSADPVPTEAGAGVVDPETSAPAGDPAGGQAEVASPATVTSGAGIPRALVPVTWLLPGGVVLMGAGALLRTFRHDARDLG